MGLENRPPPVAPGAVQDTASTPTGTHFTGLRRPSQRAAIVYAFTYDGRIKDKTKIAELRSSGQMSGKEFASLGIKGFLSENSVVKYRENWQWAIDNSRIGRTPTRGALPESSAHTDNLNLKCTSTFGGESTCPPS